MNANRLIAAGIAFIALMYVLSSSIFVVDQRKFAVVFSFGQIVRVIEQRLLQPYFVTEQRNAGRQRLVAQLQALGRRP